MWNVPALKLLNKNAMESWKTICPSLHNTPEMVQDVSRYKSKLSRYLRKEYFDDSDRLLSNAVLNG